MDRLVERVTGRLLNERWQVGASHALYREDGSWYHQLRRFPGALFDRCGYVLFESEEQYRSSPFLRIGQHLHVPGGIRSLPTYTRVTDGREPPRPR